MLYKFIQSFLCLVLLLVPQARGGEEEPELVASDSKNVIAVPAGQVIDQDYFAAGNSVEISGIVNGDVYVAGGSILVDGQINGDLLAAGGEVMVSGTISQDARIAGGRVTINGRVERNLTVAGGDIEMTPAASVQGSVVGAGGNVHLGGVIGKDAVIRTGRLVVSNVIGEDLNAIGAVIRLTSKANISGDFLYGSPEVASIDSQATIGGKVTKTVLAMESPPSIEGLFALYGGLKVLFTVANFISSLILGLLLLRFYPGFTKRTVAQLREQPLASAGMGFLVLILTPIIVGTLGMTFIALPLAFLVLAGFFIYVYLARIIAMAWVGQWILNRLGRVPRERWAFVIGLIIYTLLSLLPFLGLMVTFLAILFGLGSLLLTKKEVYVAARNQEMI